MSTTLPASPATKCDWCGRENWERLSHCAGCGTRLLSEPTPESKGNLKALLAVSLALAFGPLGLLYVRAWGTAFLMLLIVAPFIITHTGGLWVTIGVRILSAALAFYFVGEQDDAPNPSRDSARMLDQAARLESVDRSKAVAVYEDVVRLYPNTSASKEATRNIRTLTRQV